jgi:UDP-GlcNAc3NAcA epimerase
VNCITQRDKTEWVEIVEEGWNQIVGANVEQIQITWRNANTPNQPIEKFYGDEKAVEKVLNMLVK